MNADLLTEMYPRLYHMAEAGSWESIRKNGLLSTSGLLDLFEVSGLRREELELRRRSASVVIEHPAHGRAVVRDQLPIRESQLASVLEDMAVDEWLRMLNSRVFFWVTEERLIRLLGARAYRARAHDVLVVDTAALVDVHRDRIDLSPINSGATLFNAPRRGRGTFLSIEEYPLSIRRRQVGRQAAVAELAVRGGIADIQPFVVEVSRRQGDRILSRIYSR